MLGVNYRTHTARGILALACIHLLASTPSHGSVGNCLDFRPGISYLSVRIDPATIPEHYDNAIGYALASTFSEQIAINNFRRKDGFFDDFAISSTNAAVSTALGVGNDASFLFNPQDGSSPNDDITLKFIPSEESSILSDKRGIIFTNGLVNRISEQAVKSVFGSVDGYKEHLNDLAAHDYTPFLRANKISFGENKDSVPLGYILFGKDLVEGDPVVSKVATFTNEFLSKLLFATAHEMGHIRLLHNNTKYSTCAEFEARELAADRYAANYLASFVFRMEPDEFDEQRLINFESFFQNYDVYEFSGTSSGGDCVYPTARKREKEVRKAIYRATVKLKQQTYSSADITTPNPTSVICSSETKSWKVYFGDQFYVPGDEMRRRSIEESKKIDAK